MLLSLEYSLYPNVILKTLFKYYIIARKFTLKYTTDHGILCQPWYVMIENMPPFIGYWQRAMNTNLP